MSNKQQEVNPQQAPFFTGFDKMKRASKQSGGQLKLENGEKVIIKFLDDHEGKHPLAQYYSHYRDDIGGFPCVEESYGRCPLCEVATKDNGLQKKYQLLINVAVIEPSGNTVQFIRKGSEFANEELIRYIDSYGTLTDRYYQITGKAKSRGPYNWISYSMVPIDLPKDCKPPGDDLRRIDWKTFLVTPKLEALEEIAENL